MLVPAFAAAAPAPVTPEMKALQAKIDELERSLTTGRDAAASIDSEIVKLKKLLRLQQLEIEVGKKEYAAMEAKLKETETRRAELDAQVTERKRRLREQLSQLPAMRHANPLGKLAGDESLMATLHLGMIDKVVQKERHEILQLKRLQDELDGVNENLREERLRLAGHIDDLKEKQTVLSLNREMSSRRLERLKAEEAERLREFQAAKSSERKLDAVVSAISPEAAPARPSMPSAMPRAARPASSTAAGTGNFFDRKGDLPLPVIGAVTSEFGKKYDPKTNLYTFHKGIEIDAKPGSPVRAVFSGRVAFAGRLGGYRNLIIIDHGKQFYSLAGNLGETLKKVGDVVREGDVIGSSAGDDTPLYFEIRQRHIAVNPVPWFRDLKLLARSSTN